MKVFILVAVLAAFVCRTQGMIPPNPPQAASAQDAGDAAPAQAAPAQAAPAGKGFVMVDAGSSGSKVMSYDDHGNVAPKRAIETDCFSGATRNSASQRGVAALGAYQNFEGFCDKKNGDLTLQTKVNDEEQSKSCDHRGLEETGNQCNIFTPKQYKEMLIKVIKARHEKRCDCTDLADCDTDKTCIMKGYAGHTDCTTLGPPKNQKKLSMQATAGMRVLPKELNDRVWQGICDSEFDGYKFDKEGRRCGTIPGTKEAFLEYVASVEVAHKANAASPHIRGCFTVGGASAQIAFPILSEETLKAFKALRKKLKKTVFAHCESVKLPMCEKNPKLCEGMSTHVPWFAKPADPHGATAKAKKGACYKDFIDFYLPGDGEPQNEGPPTIRGLLPDEVAERVLKGPNAETPVLAMGLISFLGLDGNGNEDSKWIAGGVDAIDRYAIKQGCGQEVFGKQNNHCVPGEQKAHELKNIHCTKITSKEQCQNPKGPKWQRVGESGTCSGPRGCGKHGTEETCLTPCKWDEEGGDTGGAYKKMGKCKWVSCSGPPGCAEHGTKETCEAPCKWDEEGGDSDAAQAVKQGGKTAKECDLLLEKGLAVHDQFYAAVSEFFHATGLGLHQMSFNTGGTHPAYYFYNEKKGDAPYSEELLNNAKEKGGVSEDFLGVENLRPTTRKDLSKVAATLSHVCQSICDSFSQFSKASRGEHDDKGIGYGGGRGCFSCMYTARFIVDFFPKDSTGDTKVDFAKESMVDVSAGMLKNSMARFKGLRGRGRKAQTLSKSAAFLRSEYPDLYAHPNFHVPIQFHSTTWVDGMAATFE